MKNFKLWTALITPMHEDGRVHFEDFEKLIRRQESAGNGILILGSTGEGLALDEQDKKEIVEFASGLNISVPVMAGVGGFNLDNQKKWIEYCNSLNLDAYLVVAPLYSKPAVHGQTEWFRSLLDVSDKPCMIYNIPSRTGVKIQPVVLKELSDHSNFWAVKEASGSVAEYQEFRKAVPEIPLYSGDDAMLPFFAAAGSGGLVSVASNVWPKETNRYVELCLSGQTESLFPVWGDAVKALFSAPNPIPAKVLLNKKQVITTTALRPPLTDKDLASADQLLKMDEAIKNWYQKNG